MLSTVIRRALIACLMLLVPLATPGHSQETTGSILGTLVDDTGAVLRGVKVVFVSVDTGQTHVTVTDDVGRYSASLPIGRYAISFQLPNFKPFTTRGIALHVNDRVQVDATLDLGGAVETLSVRAERLVQPMSAVQYLIPPTAVRELPLLNRTFVQLVTLVPGVSSDLREDRCFCDQGNLDISINGARRSAVNWLLDGASNGSRWNNYTLVTSPSLEAIQEINVITNGYSAEWARNGGGIVNAITKSGTNRFSGTAYEFLRNDALNANSFFRNMDPDPGIRSTPARLRYNNFGYTLGGPALPSRKKLFFFASQEWGRSRRDKRPDEAIVPDPAWLSDSSNENYVPPEQRDRNALKLLSLWPAPNVPGRNLYRAVIPIALDTRQEFIRADYNGGAKWSLAGRVLHDRADSLGEYSVLPQLAAGHRYRAGHIAIVEFRHTARRLLHEISYQSSDYRLSRDDRMPTRGEIGLDIPEFFPENGGNLVPFINVIGLTYVGVEQLRLREFLSHTLSSALTFQYGTHTFKTGGLFALEHTNSNLSPEMTQGAFSFWPGGGFTAFQNFLRGNPDGACGELCAYTEADTDAANRFRSDRYEMYAQDTWRVHSRLTVDVGFRYAFYSPLTDGRNMLFTFVPAAYDRAQAPAFDDPGVHIVLGSGSLFNGIRIAGRDSPHGRAIYAADTNNVQPRIGAAWNPTGMGGLFLRAGYGMYFDQTQVELFAEGVELSPFKPFGTDRIVENPRLSNPGRGPSPPKDMPKSNILFWPKRQIVAVPYAYSISDPFVAPRWQHWNVGLQSHLYSNGVIDVGYVGSRGDHLLRSNDLNRPQPSTMAAGGGPADPIRPFPGYSRIYLRETAGNSRYHSLTTSFRHDAGRSGSATVNYTLGRDNVDSTYDNSPDDAPQNPLDAEAEIGAARTDRTHIFNGFYVYELPFGRGATSGWRKALLAGWQIAGITRIESGPAARIRLVNCNYNRGWCFPGYLRPNRVDDPAAGDQSGLAWFDPAALESPPVGEYGTAPVAPVRLPGRHQWDIAVAKTVELMGDTHLQFRADLINAFNQTQFLDVNTTCVAGRGTTTCDASSGFGNVTSTRPPREIQLGVRFQW